MTKEHEFSSGKGAVAADYKYGYQDHLHIKMDRWRAWNLVMFLLKEIQSERSDTITYSVLGELDYDMEDEE